MGDYTDYSTAKHDVAAMNALRKKDYAAQSKDLIKGAKICGEFAKIGYEKYEEVNKVMNDLFALQTSLDTLGAALFKELEALEKAKAGGKETPEQIAVREKTVRAMTQKFQSLVGKVMSAIGDVDIDHFEEVAKIGKTYTEARRKAGF